MSFTITLMPDQPAPEIELLRAAYAAFNARDNAALATMTPDVAWPKAFEGGSAHGHQKSALTGRSNGPRSIRTWSRFLFTWRMLDGILVGASGRARPSGTVLADEHVGHRYTLSMAFQTANLFTSSVRSRHLTRRCSERGGVVSVAERLLYLLPSLSFQPLGPVPCPSPQLLC